MKSNIPDDNWRGLMWVSSRPNVGELGVSRRRESERTDRQPLLRGAGQAAPPTLAVCAARSWVCAEFPLRVWALSQGSQACVPINCQLQRGARSCSSSKVLAHAFQRASHSLPCNVRGRAEWTEPASSVGKLSLPRAELWAWPRAAMHLRRTNSRRKMHQTGQKKILRKELMHDKNTHKREHSFFKRKNRYFRK